MCRPGRRGSSGRRPRSSASALERIAAVRGERRFTHEAADGVLDLPVGAQTSLTLELSEPVTAVGFLGKRRPVTTVRLHADEPERLLSALRQARTGPSPSLARPA
ncbi:hypothetical protein [Streptomyces sp. NPDC047197]|uniref:hypothetical protein n=1 Tax=unclassified Streptomyces TaxID=2593676 RepID=UPI0034048650